MELMMMKNKGVGLKATSNTTQVVSNTDTNIQVDSLVQVSSRAHQVSSRAHPSLHISSSTLMCNTRTSGSSSSRQTWPGTKTGRLLSSFKDSRWNGRPTGQSWPESQRNNIFKSPFCYTA